MRKRTKNYPSVQFGTSLMLVVFMILCLTAFAVLSLASAMRDYEYSKKAAEKTSDYYNADAKANRKLAEIASVLNESSQSYLSSKDGTKDPETYMEQTISKLEKEAEFDIMAYPDSENPQIIYSIPINDSQALQVALTLYTPDTSGDTLYRIVQWKEVPSKEWNNSTTLPVIGSD